MRALPEVGGTATVSDVVITVELLPTGPSVLPEAGGGTTTVEPEVTMVVGAPEV